MRSSGFLALLVVHAFGSAGPALAQALSSDPVLKADAPVDPNRPLAQELRRSASSQLSVTAVGSLLFDTSDAVPRAFDAPVQEVLAGRDRAEGTPNVTVGVLESPLLDLTVTPAYPLPWDSAPVLRAPPATAASLRQQGFNAVMLATDHALDWGIAGMRTTARALDREGIAHAGTGDTASRAAHAAYHDTPGGGGRVGFVSTSTTYRPTSEALDQRGAAPGRPGVHAIETIPVRRVAPDQLFALQKVACRFERPNDAASCANLTPVSEVTAFNSTFRAGANVDAYGTSTYELNIRHANTFLSSIREGKENADLLVAAIHSAQSDDDRTGNPPVPTFLSTLAHAAVEAGADMVVVTGRPVLGPVEIFTAPGGVSAPIFYGLGNFVWNHGASPGDGGLLRQGLLVRSIAGESLRIELYPLDLAATADSPDGWPRLAALDTGKAILSRLQTMSHPFGTIITIEQRGQTVIGVITIQTQTDVGGEG